MKTIRKLIFMGKRFFFLSELKKEPTPVKSYYPLSMFWTLSPSPNSPSSQSIEFWSFLGTWKKRQGSHIASTVWHHGWSLQPSRPSSRVAQVRSTSCIPLNSTSSFKDSLHLKKKKRILVELVTKDTNRSSHREGILKWPLDWGLKGH